MTRSLVGLLACVACLAWALPSPSRMPSIPPLPVTHEMSLSPPEYFEGRITARTQDAKLNLPAGSPPVAFDGYCPVTLMKEMVWRKGDVRYGAVHRQRTYLFASAAEQLLFLNSPDTYSPVNSGNDVCQAVDSGKIVAGKREFGLISRGRIYLFASAESMNRFQKDPARYAAQASHLNR